jgi:hypothetical protein
LAADLVRRSGRFGHAAFVLGNPNAFPSVTETDGQNYLRTFNWFRRDATGGVFPGGGAGGFAPGYGALNAHEIAADTPP